MATTITKRVLSGSTHGVGISVTATAGATYNTVHTLGTSATTTLDELYVYGQNNYSQAVDITFEVGTSAANGQLKAVIPSNDGPVLIIPGLILTGSACSIACYINMTNSVVTSATALVSLYGYVNRIVQT